MRGGAGPTRDAGLVCDACAAAPDALALAHVLRERGLEKRELAAARGATRSGLAPTALPAGVVLSAHPHASLSSAPVGEHRRVLAALEDERKRWAATLADRGRREAKRARNVL